MPMLPQYQVTWVEEHMVILASPSEEQSIRRLPHMRLQERQILVAHRPRRPLRASCTNSRSNLTRVCPINDNGHLEALIHDVWEDYTIQIGGKQQGHKKHYDPMLPIEHLAGQIESAVTIAGIANQLYTVAQVFSIAYNLVFKTDVYTEAFMEWHNKLDVEKTWPNFNCHFAAAYADNLKENTATSMGYGANVVQQQ
eukprot:9619202-Ditylum_brightwellii.AAC.1